MKRLIITLAFRLGVSSFYAQDTLRLIWQANGGEEKLLYPIFKNTNGEYFTVHWGDGSIDTAREPSPGNGWQWQRHTYNDTNTLP